MSRSYDIPQIVVKLSGGEVIEISSNEELEAAGIALEVRQYHKDFQGDDVETEPDWPHLVYEVVHRIEP